MSVCQASSQLGQFVDRRVEFEVWREEVCGTRVDQPVRLSDCDVCHARDVSDLCAGTETQRTHEEAITLPAVHDLAVTSVHLWLILFSINLKETIA